MGAADLTGGVSPTRVSTAAYNARLAALSDALTLGPGLKLWATARLDIDAAGKESLSVRVGGTLEADAVPASVLDVEADDAIGVALKKAIDAMRVDIERQIKRDTVVTMLAAERGT